MKHGGWLHTIWWHHGDKGWFGWPWVWRVYCWARGRHGDEYYGACVYCGKDLINRD